MWRFIEYVVTKLHVLENIVGWIVVLRIQRSRLFQTSSCLFCSFSLCAVLTTQHPMYIEPSLVSGWLMSCLFQYICLWVCECKVANINNTTGECHSDAVFILTCRQVLQWWRTKLCSSSQRWAAPHFCSVGSTEKWNRRAGTEGPGPDRRAPHLPVKGWTGQQRDGVMETF